MPRLAAFVTSRTSISRSFGLANSNGIVSSISVLIGGSILFSLYRTAKRDAGADERGDDEVGEATVGIEPT